MRNPSGTSCHLPWEGRKITQLAEIHLHVRFSSPARGSGRRPKGFIDDADTNRGSGRRPRGF